MTVTNWIRGQILAADDLDAAFGDCIDRRGDVMSGLLTLAVDPVMPLDAATKQYVDNRIVSYLGSITGVSSFNTRTGAVTLLSGDVTTALGFTPYNATNPAGYQTAAQVASALASYAPLNNPTFTGTVTIPAGAVIAGYLPTTGGTLTGALSSTAGGINFGSQLAANAADLSKHLALYSGAFGFCITNQRVNYNAQLGSGHWFRTGNIDRAEITDGGLVMSANTDITLVRDPTLALQAATKQYVDLRAPLASPVFTGDPQAPTPATSDNDTSIATTAFVKAAIASGASITVGDVAPSTPAANALWWDSVGAQLYLWYNDGNSTQWVPATAIPASIGEAPSDSNYYVRRNGVWAVDAVSPQVQANVGRNLIHNAMFNIQQRGTGNWTAAGAYTADRWKIGIGGTDAVTIGIATASDTDRSQIGDEAVRNLLNYAWTGTSGASSYNTMLHYVEDVRRMANKTLTLSFWAKATAGTPKLGLTLNQMMGTGGSPSANVQTNLGATTNLSATWQRYSASATLPSLAGKVLGTNNDHSLQVTIWGSDGAAFSGSGVGVQANATIQLWGIQLEVGSIMTPLDYGGTPADQLRQCQRFYQQIFNGYYIPSTASGTQNVLYTPVPVPMRAAPTVTYASNSATLFPATGSYSIQGLSPAGMAVSDLRVSSGTGAGTWSGTYSLSADL